MNLLTILIIAIGLSLDAVAVAVSLGLTIKSLKIHNGLVIGIFFGTFQALMPLVGWAAGRKLSLYIDGIDHWIAFGLLVIIGMKMIYESLKVKSLDDEVRSLNFHYLFILSIATSIDAFAIGISFALLKTEIITPIVVIGIITFVLSFLAVGFGKHLGYLFPRRIEILGGLILFGIGFKILFDHLG